MDASKGLMLLLVAACAIAVVPASGGDAPSMAEPAAAASTMPAFASEAEFGALLARWRAQAERQRAERQKTVALMAPGTVAPMPAPAPAAAEAATLDSVSVAGTAAEAESITNVQTEGVDEGDIVKAHGDYLVVLRRGRLFTIRIGGDRLQPVSTVPAHGPGVDPSGTWYDEMLLGDGRVVVVGYSYARGGTEIGLFGLDAGGGLHYRATYQLRSNDYYSARNYASRLIGDRLVFYAPLYINAYRLDPDEFMPALRRWRGAAEPAAFERILPATRIHRTGAALDLDDGIALHTVSVCDLANTPMRCESTAVLGPPGHVFYVSADAVYVWATPWQRGGSDRDASSVFRIPLDGGAPAALQASGSPIDQMSFLQRDGFLNVLVGRDADGEGMWAAEGDAGALALLRVPLSAFGDGSRAARPADYRALPGSGDNHALHNRFIGDWLVYGAGHGWGDASASRAAHAVRYAGGAPQRLLLGHGVERIDALGGDAVVVGNSGGDLHFTSVRLGHTAHPASVFVQRDAAQGDDRTHGFFYKPDAGADATGTIGLPIVRGDDSAAVLYLRNRALRLSRHGSLEASDGDRRDDGCVASCVDWYGNARPIFLGGRVFALLGYELVEGRVDARGLRERRRVDFTPPAPVAE
jgi:hypothetical protein